MDHLRRIAKRCGMAASAAMAVAPVAEADADERAPPAKKGVAIGDTGARCRPFGLPCILVGMNYPHEVV